MKLALKMSALVILWLVVFAGMSINARAPPLVQHEFSDDFESYPLGTNPPAYDYWDGVSFRWSPAPPPQPDRYQVTLLGGSQVLRYSYPGPSSHFPFASRLYRQEFVECLEGAVAFRYSQASMGWDGLLFSWQDKSNYYVAQTMFDNRLVFRSVDSGTLGSLPLWPDRHILTMDHRITVRRDGANLTATVTRLDTGASRSLTVTNTDYTWGRIGFGFDEDYWGPVAVNADDFLARGTVVAPVITATVDIDPDTLNLRSKGLFVTAYIELPEGHDVADVDIATVVLAGVPAVSDARYGFVTDPGSFLTDHDADGIHERLVRFDRSLTGASAGPGGKTQLTLSGMLTDGTRFEGSDTITVVGG